ncbi:Auxin-binding protein ABP19a [Bienertia sinuspersici]
MDVLKIVVHFFLFVSIVSSTTTNTVDFCVADFNYPVGPVGFPCRHPANLTVDDFVFSGLGVAALIQHLFVTSLNMDILKFVLHFFFFVSVASATTNILDYCVADFNFPVGPAGYPCRNPANLTADDFVFSGLGVAGNTSNIFKAGVTAAFDLTFPALNGLGLAISRLDIDVGGVVPIHTHRVSELILVIEGKIIAGFIDSVDRVFYKTLKKGDIMIFPHSLLHFQVNVGDTPALAFVSLNSANPNFQTTTTAFFANDLPTDVIEKISLLDASQVKKLKEIFGGTN